MDEHSHSPDPHLHTRTLTQVRCRKCNRPLPTRYEIRGEGTISAYCRKCKEATVVHVVEGGGTAA